MFLHRLSLAEVFCFFIADFNYYVRIINKIYHVISSPNVLISPSVKHHNIHKLTKIIFQEFVLVTFRSEFKFRYNLKSMRRLNCM